VRRIAANIAAGAVASVIASPLSRQMRTFRRLARFPERIFFNLRSAQTCSVTICLAVERVSCGKAREAGLESTPSPWVRWPRTGAIFLLGT
jgi:hypothetical protein